MVIRILDHVQFPSGYDNGEIIFDLIKSGLDKDEEVIVSFDGIHAVASPFVNAAFLRLIEFMPFEKIKRLLKIQNSTKDINELVKARFNFVVNQESAKPH
jgi:STAS-like domain of unknown function (DUF4325)